MREPLSWPPLNEPELLETIARFSSLIGLGQALLRRGKQVAAQPSGRLYALWPNPVA
jgi:hypothetical protein